MKAAPLMLCALAMLATPAAAQHDSHHDRLNERGKRFMGFDQEAAGHRFLLVKEGGLIEVTAKDGSDAASIGQIRRHLTHIAGAFGKGDFDLPALVHDTKAVPGVEAMKKHAAALTFAFEPLDRGGQVRITAATPEAVAAVHEFLRFQIKDHKTGDPLVAR
ncbi:MAG TPA: hypothetical protein VJ813_17975 [Vicinamibacterales bacterium]|nr:hypothetical protein [Vicinamibacterales bacterium]